MLIKICGITNLDDALAAEAAGADMLGFIFAESPRRVKREQVAGIAGGLSGRAKKVGVFVDAPIEEVKELREELGLDYVQLHGQEGADYCRALGAGVIKLMRVTDNLDMAALDECTADFFLLEGKQQGEYAGGTGKTFDWSAAAPLKGNEKVILSGGLEAGNVVAAIEALCPGGVDVGSGVESKAGAKDHGKVRKFIEVVRGASGSEA